MKRVLLSQDLPDKVIYKCLGGKQTVPGFSQVGVRTLNVQNTGIPVAFYLDGRLANPDGDLNKTMINLKKHLEGVADLRYFSFMNCGTIEVPKLNGPDEIDESPSIADSFVQSKRGGSRKKSAPSPSSSESSSPSSSASSSPSSSDEEDNPIPVKPSSSIKTQKFEFPGKKFITVEAEILDEDTMKSLDVEDDLVMGLGNLINDIQKGAKLHRTNTVVLTLFKTMCTINSLADETDMEPQIFYHTLNSLTQK